MGSQRTSLSIAMRLVVPALLFGSVGCGNEARDAFVTEAVASCEAASDRVASVTCPPVFGPQCEIV